MGDKEVKIVREFSDTHLKTVLIIGLSFILFVFFTSHRFARSAWLSRLVFTNEFNCRVVPNNCSLLQNPIQLVQIAYVFTLSTFYIKYDAHFVFYFLFLLICRFIFFHFEMIYLKTYF